MNTSAKLLTAALTIAASFSVPKIADAQNRNYYAGQASNGQSITIDLDSVKKVSDRSANFVYYLGNEKISAQANCETGNWTTFPEKKVNRPQSKATQTMVNAVCRNAITTTQAVLIDPPSNVRESPNGRVLCSLNDRATIKTYGSYNAQGVWYYTNACNGRMGVIHSSQIRF